MKAFFVVGMFLSATSALTVSDELAEYALRLHFQAFEATYEKVYASEEAREERFLTFVANLEEVVTRNADLAAKGADEVHGITKFSDWTKEEFVAMVGGLKTSSPAANDTSAPVAVPTKQLQDLPAAFDWRDQGIVTAVKDQGQCGSCWAHSAAEALESQFALAGEPLTPLSVQQIVSCDTSDDGCGGGWYYTAWMDYVLKAGGLAAEADYPYDSKTYSGRATACDADLASKVVPGSELALYNWATAPCQSLLCRDQDEDTLKANLVSYGPMSIAADASSWSSYTSGVMTADSCASGDMKLDHAILLVGYNEEDPNNKYWIVRNSWADTWGLDGYIHLKMGTNTCGLADKPAFPKMDAASKLRGALNGKLTATA